jgi:anti-anti-sigma factor
LWYHLLPANEVDMRVTSGSDTEVPQATLASPVGNLDAHGVTSFLETVSQRVTDATPSLLVDMTGVELMSSAGIGVLIRLLNQVQSRGGRLAIFGCNERVRQVFKITALESVLNVCDSSAAARARVRGDAG